MKGEQKQFVKGELVTIKPHPLEDIITGQQYFDDFMDTTNYLGVVVETKEPYTYVSWLRHPVSRNGTTPIRTKSIKKVLS